MAQATVELPDTATPDAANAGSADDLLSQMAGEEIDRLLADADKEPPGAVIVPAAQPVAEPAAEASSEPQAAAAAQSTAVSSTTTPLTPVEPAPASAATPATAQNSDELAQAQLDALFNELGGGKSGDTLASAADGADTSQADVDALLSAADTATEATPDIQAATDSAAAPVAPITTPPPDSDKSEVLDAQLVQTLTDVAPSPAVPAAPLTTNGEQSPPVDQPLPSSPPEQERGDPIYLKLLELISAPLDSRPTLRDWIGKIGIVTAFNGFVILIYVFFFRG